MSGLVTPERRNRRRMKLSVRLTLAALIPVIILGLTDVFVLSDRLNHARVNESNLSSLRTFDAAVMAANMLGQEHVQIVNNLVRPISDRVSITERQEKSNKAVMTLHQIAAHDSRIDAGLIAEINGMVRELPEVQERLLSSATLDNPMIRRLQYFVEVVVAIAKSAGPIAGSGESSKAFRASSRLLDIWPILLQENVVVVRYINSPSSEARMNAQPAVHHLSSALELFNASMPPTMELDLALPGTVEPTQKIIDGVGLDVRSDLSTWSEGETGRTMLLAERNVAASLDYGASIRVEGYSQRRSIVMTFALLAAATLISLWSARRLAISIVRRLGALISDADNMVRGSFDVPSRSGRLDELDDVHAAFEKVAATVRNFSSEAARLSAGAMRGARAARTDVSAYEGEWRSLLDGLNNVVDVHRHLEGELMIETSRLRALEALARASTSAGSVSGLLDTQAGLILDATGAQQVEYWEATAGNSITLRTLTTNLASGIGTPKTRTAPFETFDPIKLHSGPFLDSVVKEIRTDERLVGMLVVLDPPHSDTADAVMSSVASTLESVARKDEVTLRSDGSTNFDSVSGLPTARPLLEKLDAALEAWENDGLDFAVYRVLMTGETGEDHQELVSNPGLRARFGQYIRSNMAAGSFGAWMGGLEFAVVAPIDGNIEERIYTGSRAVAYENQFSSTRGLKILAGVAYASDVDAPSRDGMLLAARQAARVSADGGGIVRFDPQLGRKATREAMLRQHLRTDLAAGVEGPFTLEYQPIVSLTTGEVTGVEALARWENTDLGPIRPDEFIAAAESLDLIADLDRLLARKSLLQMTTSQFSHLTVFLNASAMDFARGGHADSLISIARDLNFDLRRLGVELTETAMVTRSDRQVLEQMRTLRAAGCEVAIDDFGSGHASFSYLTDLPITRVKIDRAFVYNVHRRAEAAKVLVSMTRLSHELGLMVVAEGIETEEELAVVVAADCDMAQGYLFARPVKVDELGDAIADIRIQVPKLLNPVGARPQESRWRVRPMDTERVRQQRD